MAQDDHERIHGWKGIADHFGVAPRTAQDWEKQRGLPIRRFPGPNGSVYALRGELDAWQGLNEPPTSDGGQPVHVHTTGPALRLPAFALLFALVPALLGMALWALPAPTGAPERARVVGDVLVVTDAAGVELWRWGFATDVNEGFYRTQERFHPQVVDLDADGRPEVLVIVAPTATDTAHQLLCLSSTGEELWRYTPGRVIRTQTESFDAVYVIAQARVARLGPGSRRSIVLVAHQLSYYPTELTVLSAAGAVVSQYWHAGHLGVAENSLAIADLDGDKHLEIYATGVNNARNIATLVALDPATMSGAGPELNPGYRFEGFEDGDTLNRLFFPRGPVSLASGERFNVAVSVIAVPDGLLVGVLEDTGSGRGKLLHYRLGFDLAVAAVVETDTYRIGFSELVESAGRIAEVRRLGERVEFERAADP